MRESIKRHEHFLALHLGLKPGMQVLHDPFRVKFSTLCVFGSFHRGLLHKSVCSQVLDVGCGIGGPLREIAQFRCAFLNFWPNRDKMVSMSGTVKFSLSTQVFISCFLSCSICDAVVHV